MIEWLKRRSGGQLLFGMLFATGVCFSGWMALEEFLLATDRRPITWYAREALNKNWYVGRTVEFLSAIVIGVSFDHFVLKSNEQPDYRPGTN